eukprot:2236102-Rhodomonas_salina.2
MVDVGDGGSEQGERERARDGAEAEAEAESVLLLPNETTDWNSHMYRAMQSQVEPRYEESAEGGGVRGEEEAGRAEGCLLYTSDAADDM